VNGDPDALEALDCFAVERLGGVATAHQCLRASQDAEGPVCTAGLGTPLKSPQRRGGLIDSAASRASLDKFGQWPVEITRVIVLTGQASADESGRIATEAVVQHGRDVPGHTQDPPLSPGRCVLNGRVHQVYRRGLLTPPGN